MVKILICDDDQCFLEFFKERIKTEFNERGEAVDISCFTSGKEVYVTCQDDSADVVFLDIEMPEEDGFSVAKKISTLKNKPILVFTTNIDSLVYESFQHEPIWYLLKRNIDQIGKVVDKILSKIAEEKAYYQVTMGAYIYRIPIQDILYFESNAHNIVLYTLSGKYTFRRKLSEIEKELMIYPFIRCHASYLVNSMYIMILGKNSMTLTNKTQIPISRNKLEATQTAFMNYKGRLRM